MSIQSEKKSRPESGHYVPVVTICWAVENEKTPIRGAAGVTDVVAATFNILKLLRDSKELYIVRDNSAALRALKMFPKALLVGESTEPGLPFFCSNSPPKVMKLDVKGKTIIQKTNNGTTAVADAIARGAEPVFEFHWANLKTTANWLKKQRASRVTLIASGGREDVFKSHQGHLMDDWYCAEALSKLLNGEKIDYRKYFLQSRRSIKKQYPQGDPSPETLALVFDEKETFPNIIPLFKSEEDGIVSVHNASISS